MELKPGYKQTEVGVIPEEWGNTSLCELVDQSRKITYGIVVPGPSVYDGVPLIRAQDYSKGWVELEDLYRVSHALDKAYKRSKVITGDVLLTIVGSVGNIAKVPHAFDGSNITQQTARLSFNAAVADTDYYLNVLQSDVGKTAIANFTKSGVQPSLNLSDVEKFMLPRPPLPEQRAIAAALSDVDGLLGGLDRLIAKKRDLKQAAMQQLLTGQTRLPGFQGEWEVKRLGEIGRFLKGSGVTKDQTRSGSLACVRYGELYTHHNDVLCGFHSWISPQVATTAVRLKKGDVLFAGSGETKEEIGKCAAFVSDIEAYAGGDIVILRPDDSDSVFLGYYLNTGSIARQKASRGQGDAVVHISSSSLSNILCKLPPLSEQTAIAEVLTEMDAELATLTQRREKTRALKQAMMQELLTGRTRLEGCLADVGNGHATAQESHA